MTSALNFSKLIIVGAFGIGLGLIASKSYAADRGFKVVAGKTPKVFHRSIGGRLNARISRNGLFNGARVRRDFTRTNLRSNVTPSRFRGRNISVRGLPVGAGAAQVADLNGRLRSQPKLRTNRFRSNRSGSSLRAFNGQRLRGEFRGFPIDDPGFNDQNIIDSIQYSETEQPQEVEVLGLQNQVRISPRRSASKILRVTNQQKRIGEARAVRREARMLRDLDSIDIRFYRKNEAYDARYPSIVFLDDLRE